MVTVQVQGLPAFGGAGGGQGSTVHGWKDMKNLSSGKRESSVLKTWINDPKKYSRHGGTRGEDNRALLREARSPERESASGRRPEP